MEEKYLWKFYWNCGRQGDVEGLFVATEKEIKAAIGKEVYFGEILGKHSEVYGTIEDGEIKRMDLDSETVIKVACILGDTWSGYNPLNYLKYECPICGETVRCEEFSKKKNMCWNCVDEGKVN